ncbi:MAG: TonB-dependent receptor [Chitinophagales bacterium]|nr:TonB-dependent receptor [Chitinophagales bacterium]
MKFLILPLILALSITVQAQQLQQLRGTVTDQALKEPLSGATISLNEQQHTTSDASGNFRFKDLAPGNYTLRITYAGFKEIVLDNITVNSGKETILTITLEAEVKSMEEVIVKANGKKNRPLNDMSVVSARAFTVEETQRYAAAVNDPLRMATAFPGVMANDDGNNNIIIRGNSPTGLLWRMEGMDIPSPNHFSQPGLSGGGISILSSQLLSNSDFITGAFAAEYGNALSGVFDIKLRKGNDEKREYSLQAGVLGLNAAMEGPFSKKYKGSYLINYRYSTLTLLNKVGVLPDDNVTNFQDLSFNIYLPTKKAGNFSVFGFGGLSDQYYDPGKDSSKWETRRDRYLADFVSNTGMAGITHSLLVGKNLKINSAVGVSGTRISYDEDFTEDDLTLRKTYFEKMTTKNILFNTKLDYKFSNRLLLRAGFINKQINYQFYRLSSAHDDEPLEVLLNSKGQTSTQQAFLQWQYKWSNDLSLQAGLHYLHLAHNGSEAVEPRLSAKWNINNKNSLALAYGLHSQIQTLNVYFAERTLGAGGVDMPNKNLGFTKAHHYVLSYGFRPAAKLQIKTELYYQQLFDVPVAAHDSSTLSSLNVEYEYVTDPMVNEGKGRNYGIEISIERYLHNNFYLTLSNSLYQSKYTALDGVERNTRFNGNYITTLITGKDFYNERKQKTLGINLKTIVAGGLRTTPIDLAASQQAGYTVYKEKQAYSQQNPAYFRTDLRISMKWNRRKHTTTLSLDIQNVTNRLNLFSQYFDKEENQIKNLYQTGMIPILNYKIEF